MPEPEKLRAAEGTVFYYDRRDRIVVVEQGIRTMDVPIADLLECAEWLTREARAQHQQAQANDWQQQTRG